MTTSRPETAHSFEAQTPPGQPIRGIARAAGSSAAVAVLALLALVMPALNPYSDSTNSPLGSLVGATAMTAALALLGLVSAIVALAARHAPGNLGVQRSLVVLGCLNALGLGLAIQGTGTLILAGYSVALLLPIAVALVGWLAFRAYPRARPWLVLAAIVLVVGFWLLRRAYLPMVGKVLIAYAGELPDLLGAIATLTCAGCWAAVLVRNQSGGLRPLLTWAARHRTVLTVLAALGPAPYVMLRLTWLTPWPQLTVGEVDPGGRIWGLLLGSGAILGMVLTIGLIRPWGERIPRWFPVVGGRPVPPAAAIVPGALMATMITAAAGPMIVAGIGAGEAALGLVMLPLWYWGPMLGLAVLGYAGHRAGLGRRSTHSTATATPSTMNP